MTILALRAWLINLSVASELGLFIWVKLPKKVDILKLNDEEAKFLSGIKNIEEAANKLYLSNLDAIIITLGKNGCFYKTSKLSGFIPTIKIKPVDTTGAGDAFNAGYLSLIINSGKNLSQMSKNELENGLKKANIISSLTTLKKGAISAFPSETELLEAAKKYLWNTFLKKPRIITSEI